jgi:nucleoside-diphosphate-sugar epimerase
MKVLVTGAAGFVGRELVARLARAGYRDIRAFVRPGSDVAALRRIDDDHPGARIECVRGNLSVRGDVDAAVSGVGLVFHLAAAMKGSPADMFLSTVVGSKRLLEALSGRDGARVVLVSSLGVYDTASLPRGALLDENAPLERFPEKRDPYSHAKWRQEILFREYHARRSFPLVIARPGVVYGPGGSPLSARVGVGVFGLFLAASGSNRLPLSFVTNCADALIAAARSDAAAPLAVNVVDDDLPTCRSYLRRYRREVRDLRVLPVPYTAMRAISWAVEYYSQHSRGQLPAVFTAYRTAALWKGTRFSNERLKSLGWTQAVPTEEGLRRTFAYWRERELKGGSTGARAGS